MALIVGLVVGLVVDHFHLVDTDKIVGMVPFFPRPDAPLNFLVVGDWGRDGKFNQSWVAESVRGPAHHSRQGVSCAHPLWCTESRGGAHQPDPPRLVCSACLVFFLLEWHPCVPFEWRHSKIPCAPLEVALVCSLCLRAERQMGVVASRLQADFIISTGDNFYLDGLHNVSDPQFETSFSNVYSARSLMKQWFAGACLWSRPLPCPQCPVQCWGDLASTWPLLWSWMRSLCLPVSVTLL